jgi:hypothetical protein
VFVAGFVDRLRLSFQILQNKLPTPDAETVISSYNATYNRIWRDNASTVLAPIKTRIAMDAAAVNVRHVRVDESEQYLDTIVGELNDRLTLKANIDQTGVAFIQDVVMTMLEHGVVAVVPTDVTTDPSKTTAYDILSMRTGIVEEWFNKSVQLSVYNESIGDRTSIVLPKSFVALCYNPLYSVMNEPNSTLKRLIDKLSLLDFADNKMNSPNLDLILQLPYAVRNNTREKEADRRLRLLEEQLHKSQYGIAYVDGTEKITQLNRPVANTLGDQVKYLTDTLYNQLGLTETIFSGSADPEELLAYHNRTIAPILKAITSSIKMAFLTTTAIRQGQSIMSFPDLFKMAPIDKLADASDKFTRNEIMSSNEVRQRIGIKPKDDPAADELRNKNLNKQREEINDQKSET